MTDKEMAEHVRAAVDNLNQVFMEAESQGLRMELMVTSGDRVKVDIKKISKTIVL